MQLKVRDVKEEESVRPGDLFLYAMLAWLQCTQEVEGTRYTVMEVANAKDLEKERVALVEGGDKDFGQDRFEGEDTPIRSTYKDVSLVNGKI